MNAQLVLKTQHLKLGLVSVAVLAIAWLAWSFYDFAVRNKQKYLTPLSSNNIQKMLEKEVLPKVASPIKTKRWSEYSVLYELNVTGKEAPPLIIENGGPKVAPNKTIADLLRVVYIQHEPAALKKSRGYVVYLEASMAANAKEDFLEVDDHLPNPYDAVRLAEVKTDRLVFHFEGQEGKQEEVAVQEFNPMQALAMAFRPSNGAGPDGSGRTMVNALVGYPQNYSPPQQTTQMNENEYWIGIKDSERFEKNYQASLRDLKVSPYFEPGSDKPSGVKVDRVPPNSPVYSYGVQTGDVIKSINGNPVSSKEAAINWVKANPDLPRYDVEIERQGKIITKTYVPPPRRK